jgi:hypothetical protein
MAFISFGKCRKKIIFPIISIIISYLIFNIEYYSGFFFDLNKFNSPKLYSLYFSFSFLGCFIYGGIFLLISHLISRTEFDKSEEKFKEGKKTKNLVPKKTHRYPSLIYNEEISKIHIHMIYFIISAFLELLVNFSFSSIVFDFIDIEAKMLYSAFDIIFIKIISKLVFKFQLYRHQIFSMIFLMILLCISILFRENFMMKIFKGELHFYENDYEEYLRKTAKDKIETKITYQYYFIFIVIGFFMKAFSVCFDKWLITDKLCNPYKLLFFKGLYGFIPAFMIQLLLYYILGENLFTDNYDDITNKVNIKNLYKRLSFPFSSFISYINITIIIFFFILIGFSYTFNIAIINSFNPEFIGFVNIASTTLALFTIQLINAIMIKKIHRAITISLILLSLLIIILIPSLILCEIIVLHFCNCDQNISLNIENRAILEENTPLELYESDDDDSKKNETFNSEELSSESINF